MSNEAQQPRQSFSPGRKWSVGFDVVVRTLVVLAVLVWQAGAAATMLARHSWANADVAWSTRLLASTDERLRMMLGADADTLFALRTAAEPGAIWVLQKVVGRIEDVKSVAEFERCLITDCFQ